MTYSKELAGRPVPSVSDGGSPADDAGFMTFEAVLERLVDAMRHWWRSHDSDGRFSLGGRVSAIWRQTLSEPAFIDIQEAALRPLPLSRADIARMTEASEWLAYIGERDRKLVTLALVKLAAGAKQVPWNDLWLKLGRGRPGPDGLRWRFNQAITAIANRLNAAEKR